MGYETDTPADPGDLSLRAEMRDGQVKLAREFEELTREIDRTALVLIFTVSIYLILFQAWSPVVPLFIVGPIIAFGYGLVRRTVRYLRMRRRIAGSRVIYDEAVRSLNE